QDTDQLQYSILSKIWCGEQSTLFLIGDPKQAIYAFRGADVYAYLGAKRDAGERCYTLATNWRSDPAMIEGVGALFARAQSPFGDEGIPFGTVSARPDARNELEDPTGEPRTAALDLLFYARADDKLVTKEVVEADLPSRVAADIARLLRGGARIESRDVRPGDIAVLCRTNAQTNAICTALREVGVPAALLGTASVFDTDEAQELEWVLDAIATPRSASRVRAALSTHLFGVVAETFDAFAEDEGQWDAWLRRFVGWHELWHKRGFIRMFHQLLRDGRVHLRLLEREGGERHLTNFLHLAELAERASLHDHLGPAGLVNWLARMRGDRDVRGNTIGEEGELRLETDEHAVKVVTVHKSKGLEYPIVYCPYLYESAALRRADKARVRFHDPACKTKIVLDLGSAQSEDHVAIAELESLAEDMRMLYVALTRAKHRCSIVWGGINGAANSALFSLLHPEAASLENFKTMDDEALREDLEGLVDASGGAVRLRDLPVVPAASVASEPVRVDFRPVDASREISSLWRHSSFSALAASKGDAPLDLSPAREEGIDHDAVVEPVALAGPVVPEHEIRLSALQPGAATGTLVHSILEHLDFQRPALEQFTGVIEERLDTHGVAAHEREQIAHDLDRIRETPWSAGGPRLLDLPRSQRLDELEFLLPVAGGEGASRSHKGMSVDALADVFRVHAEDDFQREYAERVARLRFDALAGYLKGYIDLVFDWNDRFYIVDYKSNHLGSQMTDYLPDRLDLPMAQHHYVLQYHLYTVALDRYLLQRVADYDYDRHFGGIYYLFLRGMDPGHAPGCGIFHHRPNRARIEALSVLLDDPGSLAA
ncbi:MAG: UvrD-helicase domain-containing protein, partial [bacterium]|nr:UvrD-helicase domain-containing protein [bacterium]